MNFRSTSSNIPTEEKENIYSAALQIHTNSLPLARNFFSKRHEFLNIQKKADKTFVSQADLKIEDELRKNILLKFPDHNILGEEFGAVESKNGSPWKWVLDPIDGTFSFVHGVPFYSSLMALYYNNEPVIGIASLPELNITISACLGLGAKIIENNTVYPIQNGRLAKSNDTLEKASELFSCADFYRFKMAGHENLIPFFCQSEVPFRTYCDALAYYFLLTGTIQCFVDPKTEIWDTAPFYPIMRESGMQIHSWDFGNFDPMHFNNSPNSAVQLAPKPGPSVCYNPTALSQNSPLQGLLQKLKQSIRGVDKSG
jgi:fructose-1,6-bisphosphatase/inositol monophosphatase family enzyme